MKYRMIIELASDEPLKIREIKGRLYSAGIGGMYDPIKIKAIVNNWQDKVNRPTFKRRTRK